jgi:hypothetical protein
MFAYKMLLEYAVFPKKMADWHNLLIRYLIPFVGAKSSDVCMHRMRWKQDFVTSNWSKHSFTRFWSTFLFCPAIHHIGRLKLSSLWHQWYRKLTQSFLITNYLRCSPTMRLKNAYTVYYNKQQV